MSAIAFMVSVTGADKASFLRKVCDWKRYPCLRLIQRRARTQKQRQRSMKKAAAEEYIKKLDI